MIESLTEVNSLNVPEIFDAPGVFKMAVVIGLADRRPALRTLEETALYLKKIGLTEEVLPTSTISFIEHQAFAKLRRNLKLKDLYQKMFNSTPSCRACACAEPSSLPKTAAPSSAAKKLTAEMQQRRALAAKRREARCEV